MNQPELYETSNQVQRYDAARILKEYSQIVQWRNDGSDSLIDIGCGSGDVLIDYIYPLLPENFERVTGTDCSDSMIRHASKRYKDFKKLDFAVLDIVTDELPVEFVEQYDHITSFYCLHWISEQNKALRNMHKMLRREGGDCLIVFLATHSLFSIYETLSQQPKWASYMHDVQKFMSPQHNSHDPVAEIQQLLLEAGFVHINVEVRSEVFTYFGENSLKNNILAVNPFLERIPKKQHEEFLNDFFSVVDSLNLREAGETQAETKVISPYKLIVAYARKISDFTINVVPKKSNKGLI